MLLKLRQVTKRTTLLLIWLTLLTACGADQPSGPTLPPGGSDALSTATAGTSDAVTESTPTSVVSVPTTPAATGGNASRVGIDMSKANPCDLLTRDEAEAVMGPLDWKPSPRAKICDYDDPVQGNTPEKSLAVRLIERDGWMDEFDNLQGPGTLLIPRQEVGLGSEVALRYDKDSVRYKLPSLCKLELPCVIAHEAPIPKAGSVWMTLTAIMPDRSAFQILIYPQNVEYAKQLARKALERLPVK